MLFKLIILLNYFKNGLKRLKEEINDPNALALGTVKDGVPQLGWFFLKILIKGFVFHNLNSQKGNEIKENPNATMCFHWKSLLRQMKWLNFKTNDDKIADEYYNSNL